MKKKTLLLLLYLLPGFAFAQNVNDSLVYDISCIKDLEKNDDRTFFFSDSTGSTGVSQIRSRHFLPFTELEDRAGVKNSHVKDVVWLSFTLKNSLSQKKEVLLNPGSFFNKIRLYKSVNNAPLQRVYDDASTGFVPVTMAGGEQAVYYLRLNMFKLKYNKIKPVLIEPSYLKQFKRDIDAPYNERNNGLKLISGMLLLMVMFTLVNFITTKKREFFYNFLYSLLMFFLSFFNAYLTRSSGWFRGFFLSWFDLVLLIAATVAYIEFVMIFLRETIKHVWLDKFLRFEKYTLIVLMAFYTYLHFFTKTFDAQELLENIMKIFMLGAAIVYIIVALRQKNKLTNYLVAGTALQVICSLVSLVIIILGVEQVNLFTSAGFFFGMGVIASVVFYLMGLTYKNRTELIEKIKDREAFKLAIEKQEFEKQIEIINAAQKERNRISADMHDDLGAGMTTIRLYSELALNKMGTNKIPEIEKISNSANDLLNKMNAIIWSMSSSNDTFSNMIAYIRSYALGYCEDNNLQCNVSLPAELPELVVSGEIRRNVFLVVKEALHNIVKHSGANKVALTLTREGELVKFIIHDNGKGIDLTKTNLFGNGLRNMKKRMEDLQIRFAMENNNGTMITLSYEL